MRNGVEVIVATDRNLKPAEPEYLRHLSSTVIRPITLAPHTLTNLMSMVLPTDHSDDNQKHLLSILQPTFTTKTYYTTYDYPATISKDNITSVSKIKTTITNVQTEELSESKLPVDIQPTATQPIILSASPTLRTEVFPTAYTYWNTFLDGDVPIVMSSTRTLSNTLVGTFETSNELEPSEVFPSTNTYLKTIGFTKTITDGTDFQVISTKDLVTQVIVTDKLLKKATNVPVTTDVTKTYFVTYTYFSTYIDGDQTKVKSDVSVSSDVTIEKFYIKPKKTETKTTEMTSEAQMPTKFSTALYPFSVLATKTYLTTYTFFTTLLQGPNTEKPELKISSRTELVENTLTETIPLQDFHTNYLLMLNSSLNRITGSLVTTATLKGGEKIKITAHRKGELNSSYLKYEIKPTKTMLFEESATEFNQIEKSTQEFSKSKSNFSSSNLFSKTKTPPSQKSKIKSTKTIIREATAEALIATSEEASVTPTVTFTAASSSIINDRGNSSVYSSTLLSPSTVSTEEATVTSSENAIKDNIGEASEDVETDSLKKKPIIKHPNNQVNVTNLLNLNSLNIGGMNVLGPVFNAMAELIHGNLNKNPDSVSRRNDTVAPAKEPEQSVKKPTSNNINPLLNFVNKFTPSTVKGASEPKVKVTTPRAPVYIPVGSFAKDSEFGESQNSEVIVNRPENWHEKWTDTHAKNFEKGRPQDPPITILEGGIPISPGQVITTNSDVIIGRPGETGPRPPTFALQNNIPIGMKPPPLPSHAQFSGEDEDGFVGQHSSNLAMDLSVSLEQQNINPPPPLFPPFKKRPHQPHKNLRPQLNFKGSLQQKNPLSGKNTHSDYDSGTADLNPPPVPPPSIRPHDVHQPITINHEQKDEFDSHKTPNKILSIPLHLGPNQNVENYINPAEINPGLLYHTHLESLPSTISESTPNINEVNPNGILLIPTVAHVPLNFVVTENSNKVDRSTGHQLLVNIQPSQVANIVIPHGSSTALILSDGKQHSMKGEVIDDPSPHPEPETVGFVGAEPVLKIENEDIATSFHNDVIPAEAAEVAQQSVQDNRTPFSNRPHLTTEIIKIRPKPVFDKPKGQHHITSLSTSEGHIHHSLQAQEHSGHHSLPGSHLATSLNPEYTLIGNHRPKDQNHKTEEEIKLNQNPFPFEGYNVSKVSNGIYSNLQALYHLNGAKKESQVNQNYRKEEFNINNLGGSFLNHVKAVPNPEEVYLIQNQHELHNYLMNAYPDHKQFIQPPNPVRGENGIYVDISPPGHLPPRPNVNLLHQSLSTEKQQPTLKEHLKNHQSGLVHDVPLNAQVQLGSGKKKENPLKEILISANSNKHDNYFDSKKKLPETKFSENHFKRPLPELTENLSPPPLSNDNTYGIHRPHLFIPNHSVTSGQRYPPHPHPNVPKPADFMIPPPQQSHRPAQKPQDHHSRPIIPIGAGGPQQNYPNPRPEDLLIVPHKNRPSGSVLNYVSHINHDIKQTVNIPSDLDMSDTSDPLKTEYGEEIQESISRPLFPGQLPAELQKLNSSSSGHIQNHKDTDGFAENYGEVVVNSKPKKNTTVHFTSGYKPGSVKVDTTVDTTIQRLSDHQHKKSDLEPAVSSISGQTSEFSSINHAPFFTLIKKPSGFVTPSQEDVSTINQKKPSGFANHKESPNSENNEPQNFKPSKVSTPGIKPPTNGGSIRIHAIGPSALPSGFVKNKNTENQKQPSTDIRESTSNDLVQKPSTIITTSNSNKIKFKLDGIANNESAGHSVNKKPPSNDISLAFNVNDKTIKPSVDSKDTKNKTSGTIKNPTGIANYPTIGQNKPPIRHDPSHNYKGETISSFTNQKYNTHSVIGQTSKPAEAQEAQSSLIHFDSKKVSSGYSTSEIFKGGSNKPQRYPITEVALTHNIKPNKRPSGFMTSKKEENKVSESTVSSDTVPLSVIDNKKPPSKHKGSNSGAFVKIPSGFTYKNQSDHSLVAISNHNYGNKTVDFYKPKPTFISNEEREVTYNKPENNVDKWFASNFGGGDLNIKTETKPPPAHRNMSSLPNKILPPDSDVHITLLPPPRGGDGRPKPEDVMGLSPPPLERPRRPQRPKPPFKLEVPTTSKSTLPPIAIENDFPPVRSPDFNRKPLKPQDIFPPRLPDNFVHHIPEYPIRNHLPQRPITSLPIDTPEDISTEKSIFSDANSGRDTFFAGSEINGHSKPVTNDEPNLSSMRPPPLPQPSLLPSNNRVKPAPHLKASTIYQQPPKVRTTDRIKEETVTSKQISETSVNISPTSTVSSILKTTFHTKLSTSVTPTAEQTQKNWHYADIITGSETVFDPAKFSSYSTPSIHDFTSKRNIITTLVSTGSTTIFGDLFTVGPKKTSDSKKSTAAIGDRETVPFHKTTEETTLITPTKTAMHTTTLTVTTTMTTVVHSIGHKPFTKTVVLTKTLISTVFNKVTETKTLVKPTTATIIQTHTIATTKTALVVPTALYPTQTKYSTGGTLKPEIFVADPHAKDTMTISVSSSMNKNKHSEDKGKPIGNKKETSDKDSIFVFMSNKDSDDVDDNSVEVISHEDTDMNDSRVVVGGVFDASNDGQLKEKNKEIECTPGCKAKRNELCQRIEGVMKCVCRPGFARMFPDRPCRPTYTFNVHLLLEKFDSEENTHEKNFAQSASPNMAKLASATKEGLDRMIMQSDLRDIYHGIMVNGFQGKEKKTMVDFYVQLSENTDEAKLMEIFKKTLQTSNYSLGGTELFAAKESGSLYAEDFNECLNPKFHDCSENARCFNLKGTYTCSCKEGFTDLSENSQFPGRLCSDTIGCEYCGYHGACYSKGEGQITCECFQWYSGERCHINLKVLLIALVTIGAVLLALLLVCAVLACLNRRNRGSATSRTNGSTAGYLRYRGPSTQSLDRRAMIADSSSESSIDNLPYVCAPTMPSSDVVNAKKKPALRHAKGPAPRPLALPGMERDRSVTVMIPRAKYRPMPPLSPHLTMSTFSPDKHLSKTAAQIATEQKLINYLDGNSREDRTFVNSIQNNRQVKEQQKLSEFKAPSPKANNSPKPEQKKESKIFEYEYKMSNMLFTEETNSADKRSYKSLDDRFRRHSDSTHLNSDTSNRNQFRKYSAGALVSAGYEVSAKVGMHHLEEDTTEDDQSAIINTHTMKSNRSQFTTLNRTGDHKTMSEARSYEETTVHPSTRSLKTHYSGSSPSSRVNNDEGHTMIERDLGSTFIMPESQLFKPEADRGSDISNFDSL